MNDLNNIKTPSPPGEPIRVFVGATEEQRLAVQALRFSIERWASAPVLVAPLHHALRDRGIELPTSSRPELRARTPFSFQRFAIPQLVDYAGRAIYLDSDMLVFRDIAQLWQAAMPVPLRTVRPRPRRLRKPQLSVMLLDCTRLDWRVDALLRRLDSGQTSYAAIMDGSGLNTRLARDLPSGWNDLECFHQDDTALLHYTDMSRQPWLDSSNRLAPLWCEALFAAVDAGFIEPTEVSAQVDLGWVRPSLAYQLEHRIADPRQLPRRQRLHDLLHFVPPHRRGSKGQRPSQTERGTRRLAATLRLTANDLGLASARTRIGHAIRLVRSRVSGGA